MKKILIVEDDPGILDVLRIICETAGYETTTFLNGNTILAGNYELPDLFVLDKQLSGVDGLDICRFLKKEARSAAIPIIIISATPHVRQLARSACADGFLEKPFDTPELLQMLEGLLQ